jgi:hypothetical protein
MSLNFGVQGSFRLGRTGEVRLENHQVKMKVVDVRVMLL